MDFAPFPPFEFLFLPFAFLMGLVPLALAATAVVFLVRISNSLERIERHLAGRRDDRV